MDATYGDRKIELVFIGQYLEKEDIIAQLNSCLITQNEEEVWKEKAFPQDDKWPIAR